jgi:hypothetical protein
MHKTELKALSFPLALRLSTVASSITMIAKHCVGLHLAALCWNPLCSTNIIMAACLCCVTRCVCMCVVIPGVFACNSFGLSRKCATKSIASKCAHLRHIPHTQQLHAKEVLVEVNRLLQVSHTVHLHTQGTEQVAREKGRARCMGQVASAPRTAHMCT